MTETEKQTLLSLVREYGRTCVYVHDSFTKWLKADDSAKLTKAKNTAEELNIKAFDKIIEFLTDK